MAGQNPSMVIRVAATIAELKANLAEGKSQIETTTGAMQKLAASFSGDKLIQAAHNVTAAVQEIGGISKLTESEMARVNATLEKALAKYQALGKEAPASMTQLAAMTQKVDTGLQQMTTAAGSTTTAFGVLHTGLNQADRTLTSLGVNIGPQVQALNELSAASGKTVTQLGLIGTAGLALGAGVAGWKLGRMIADFFDLDQKIGDATAKLLGFGDVAGETAAYKADILAKASQEAGRQITSMADAERILTEASKAHQESLMSSESLMERYRASLGNAGKDASKLTDAQRALIVEATKYGESVGEISKALHLNERAVQAVVDAEQKHIEKMKQAAEEAEKAAKLQEQRDTAYRQFKNQLGEQEIKDEEARQKRIADLDRDYDKLMSDSRNAEGLARMKADEDRMKAEEAALQHHLEVMLGLDKAYLAQPTALAASITESGTGIWTSDMAIPIQTSGNIWSSPVGARARGGPVRAHQPYMVGERGPELFVPRSAGTIVPNGGGGGALVVHIDARESFFDTPASLQRLAQKVSAAIVAERRSHGLAAG